MTRELMAVMVGQFFEQLTGAIFPDTDVDSYLNPGDNRPDVIAWSAGPRGADLLIEVKASAGNGHLFDVDQLQTYQALTERRGSPWTRPQLYYALWLYRGRHWAKTGSSSELLDHLCSSVEALYLLPGRFMEALVAACGPKTYESWRGSKRSSAGHYARLSRLQHHILRWARPEALRAVATLLDVPVNGWHVTATRVETAELVGQPVVPFPVVLAANWSLKRSLCK